MQYKAYTASSWGAAVWIVLSTQLKLGFIFAAVQPDPATVSGQQNSAGASKPALFTQHLPNISFLEKENCGNSIILSSMN